MMVACRPRSLVVLPSVNTSGFSLAHRLRLAAWEITDRSGSSSGVDGSSWVKMSRKLSTSTFRSTA